LQPKICCLSEDVKRRDNETLVLSTIYVNAACVITVECRSGFVLECDVLWRKELETAVGVDIWSYSICRLKCVREICKIKTRIREENKLILGDKNRLNSLYGGSEKKKKNDDDDVN